MDLLTPGKTLFDLSVWAGNDVNRHQLTHAPRGGSARIGGGLHRADIPAT